MSKDRIDEELKFPIFEQKEFDIVENVYVLENGIIRGYYFNNSLIAYFVTITGEERITLPENFQGLVNNKELGDFTYYEIEQLPYKINSYVTLGIGNTFYSEVYNFGAFGNYYDFYFLDLQYGVKSNEYVKDFDEFCTDNEVTNDNLGNIDKNYVVNRKKSYPNTYGICMSRYTEKVYDMISDYSNFDWNSIQE